mgnify:CR=1 FL=1
MDRLSIISAVLFLSGAPSYALPIEETAEDSARVKDIEEVVIVYSPKETGKLRQAPIAVSLFDRTALDDQHTASLKELSAFVPNFYMPDYGQQSDLGGLHPRHRFAHQHPGRRIVRGQRGICRQKRLRH